MEDHKDPLRVLIEAMYAAQVAGLIAGQTRIAVLNVLIQKNRARKDDIAKLIVHFDEVYLKVVTKRHIQAPKPAPKSRAIEVPMVPDAPVALPVAAPPCKSCGSNYQPKMKLARTQTRIKRYMEAKSIEDIERVLSGKVDATAIDDARNMGIEINDEVTRRQVIESIWDRVKTIRLIEAKKQQTQLNNTDNAEN